MDFNWVNQSASDVQLMSICQAISASNAIQIV